VIGFGNQRRAAGKPRRQSAILVGITVFLGVMLGSFAAVMSRMSSVAMGSVSMMRRLLVVTFIVMLRSFTVVVSGLLVVFGG